MQTITLNSPNSYDLEELRKEAKSQFTSSFKDLNEINDGEKIRIYLNSKSNGDDAKFQKVLNDHDVNAIRTKRQNAKAKLIQDRNALLTKLGIDESDLKLLTKLIRGIDE
jgi:hypothetical protein